MELSVSLYLSPPCQFHSSPQPGVAVTLATPCLFFVFFSAPVTTKIPHFYYFVVM